MSWQTYIDNLIATKSVDKAAIFSRAGDSVWAKSAGFEVSAPEVAEISKGFDNSDGLQAKGLHLQSEKYFLILSNDRSIYGKKGAEGVCCVRTKQAILIAHYPSGVVPGEAAKVVEKLADYLISVGY